MSIEFSVVFGVGRILMAPVILGTLSLDRFVKGIFPLEPKVVRCHVKPLPTLIINNLPVERNDEDDRAQDVMMTEEEHATGRVRRAEQRKYSQDQKESC